MMPRVREVKMIAEILKCEELAHVPIPLLSAKADEELKIQLLSEQLKISSANHPLKKISSFELETKSS